MKHVIVNLITCLLILGVAGDANAGAYRPIQAKHFCVDNGSRIEIQFVVTQDYGKGKKMRYLWALGCNINICTGARISLDNIDRGEPLGFFDVVRISDATVWRSADTGSITVTWGVHQVFIRPKQQDATYIEQAAGLDGSNLMTSARCPSGLR